jgi:hypothetical protein
MAALTRQVAAANGTLELERGQLKVGVGSAIDVNLAELRAAEFEGLLLQARAEKLIAETSLESIKQGSFYNTRQLVGDLPQLEVTVDDCRRRVVLAQQRATQCRDRLKRLTYTAPFDGRVVKLLKAPGASAARGETLVVLEKRGDGPVIDAFVTQEEANALALGARAAVWVPALGRAFEGRVVRIDRTSGFLAEVQGDAQDAAMRHAARGQKDRSAHVQLILDDLPPEALAELAGGMPAEVSVAIRPFLWSRARTTFETFNH